MSWKWIVGQEQASNALRFATKEECEAYGRDLGWRWLGMPEPALAVECSDPVNEGRHTQTDVEYERAAEDASRIADAREGFSDE